MSTTRVAQELLKQAGKPNRFLTDVDERVDRRRSSTTGQLGVALLRLRARPHVLARSDAWTEKAYLEAKRAGRSTRLDRAARKDVWKVLEAFEAALVAQGGGDDIALARDASALVATVTLESPYSAIVCDESQDLGATDLRLLAALPAILRQACFVPTHSHSAATPISASIALPCLGRPVASTCAAARRT
jgi:hypothetical protein